ncbi:hypothetical protein EXIGLDRAFT_762356 [Exidia glandulosa HHB12029]|uniref:Uncharacterized protein n=1 Tax=Exidia glandulosa HHB12029 TaxID=1314781 RepID=A0A166BBK3_EXIGL|nr:hypothetical protein EXIGLDRAFT_762356 [Exidia glandulosa HHB12029]
MSKDPETFPMPADDLTFNPSYELYGLRPSEEFWRDRMPFLRAAGYSLRRRYQPHWFSKWPMQGHDMESIHQEDSWPNPTDMVIDADRREDASLVAIICRSSGSVENELAILRFLSDEKLRRHPDNHCAPLLDVFHDPEAANPQRLTFLVTPWLYEFEQWPFETVNNALDFVHQT